MSHVESDDGYDTAKSLEDGLHPGRSDPARGLIVTVAVALGAIVAVCLVLGWFNR